MSEQRLIDANALKEQIDYAPTVEYPFYAEAYQTGYEEGKNERTKGDTTDSCDMNFFEPEKHMRGDNNGKS